LHLDPLAIHERSIGAAVHQHVALRRDHDLGVAPRDILVRNHDVAACLAAKNQGLSANGVFPPVRQTDQAASRRGGGRLGGARLHLCGHLGHVGRADELGTTASAGIGDQDLMAADLKLVAMKHGGRLGTQPDTVQQHLGAGRPGSHRCGPVGRTLNYCVAELETWNENRCCGIGTNDQFSGGNRMSLPTVFELKH
jgi:hypothetical protein